MTVPEMFPRLLSVMTNPSFQNGEAAGAETPFYICPYAIEEQAVLDDSISHLVRRLADANVTPLVIDVFSLMVDCLKANDDLDWTYEHEGEQSFADLRDDLQSVLEDEIVPAIAKKLAESSAQVLLLTNIGACYPVLRAHKLLNNLPSVVKRLPLVLFFPGEYRQIPGSGASLALFGRLTGDGYYRAFNILEAQI